MNAVGFAAQESRPAQTLAPAARPGREAARVAPAFASVEIHHDIAAVAGEWAELLADALASPYQTPGLLAAWASHSGAAEGVRALIVLARDERGRAVALLPFCQTSRLGVRVARFLGSSHVNYNMAVIRRDRVEAFAQGEAARLLAAAAKAAGLDGYHLVNQPQAWMGTPNPLACLPRQPSADQAFCGPLGPTIEEHVALHVSAKTRSKQRRKMRRFEERGAPRIYRAETLEERRRLLDAFLEQKAAQFAARGLDNVFEQPGAQAFLAEACGLRDAPVSIELYGFEMDDDVVAVTGGLTNGRRYSSMFISITGGEHAKYSPGEMLLNFVVEQQIRRGLTCFDLGVGAAAYKRLYCPEAEPLFDSIYGVTAKGRAFAAVGAAAAALKAKIKTTPWAYDLVGKIRKARAARSGAQPDVDADAAD